jgi:hypothetical protein
LQGPQSSRVTTDANYFEFGKNSPTVEKIHMSFTPKGNSTSVDISEVVLSQDIHNSPASYFLTISRSPFASIQAEVDLDHNIETYLRKVGQLHHLQPVESKRRYQKQY